MWLTNKIGYDNVTQVKALSDTLNALKAPFELSQINMEPNVVEYSGSFDSEDHREPKTLQMSPLILLHNKHIHLVTLTFTWFMYLMISIAVLFWN